MYLSILLSISSSENCKFKIELVKRENRNAAYFIIQPNGTVVVPIENSNTKKVDEICIGDMLKDNIDMIVNKWNKEVNIDNYYSNIRLRKINQSYFLRPIDKKLLYAFVATDNIPSVKSLSEQLNEPQAKVEEHINMLYEYRIIKNIIPIVNLQLFGIKTFLATLHFSKHVNYPEGHIEEYLCYNAYIGWITKCENNTFRIAIFAKNQIDAVNIIEEIQKDLNGELKFDIHTLQCSYAIGEKKLFTNIKDNLPSVVSSTKYNSNEEGMIDNIKITAEEFYTLQQIETLRKPLKENIDQKIFLKRFHSIFDSTNDTIMSLKQKNIIEQLLVRMDTRLLGYDWYIIFVQVQRSKMDELIEYLRSSFNNITHINSMIPNDYKWNLDFEVHVLSYADVTILIEQIEKDFSGFVSVEKPLKIIRECKFSFLPHYIADMILNYYVTNNEQDNIN